jgi:hypothetical protein
MLKVVFSVMGASFLVVFSGMGLLGTWWVFSGFSGMGFFLYSIFLNQLLKIIHKFNILYE